MIFFGPSWSPEFAVTHVQVRRSARELWNKRAGHDGFGGKEERSFYIQSLPNAPNHAVIVA